MKHLLKIFTISTFLLVSVSNLLFAQIEADTISKDKRLNRIMAVKSLDEVHCYRVVREMDLYREGWDTLQQVMFWNDVCTLEPIYVNVYDLKTRETYAYLSARYWGRLGGAQRTRVLDSIRKADDISAKTELCVTSGRKDFYLFEETIPNIHKAIDIFLQEKTDPWYAQAILLIESPGARVKTSSAGARGSFQLMPEVALDMGLVVNEEVDDRTNFTKSAKGAAGLLRRVCIPQARNMLKKRGIRFHETDLWFRLLVMHCYHAGSGNVEAALKSINPKTGGPWLIQRLWKTEVSGFRNESQNYSQIATAAVWELMKMIDEQGDIICEVKDVEW